MKSVLLSTVVASSLVLGSFNAHADGFNNSGATDGKDGKVMSQVRFYDTVEKTKPNEVAAHFGKPDEVIVMKKPSGSPAGVVWVYRDAVLKTHGMMDASFVLVDGEMKYVSLSDSAI